MSFSFSTPSGERDIGGARGDRVDRAAERLRAAGAVILDAGHRDVGQAQRDRERHGRLADCCSSIAVASQAASICFVSMPASASASAIRLDHQLLGVHVPALAEFRAAHAENGDLVANARGHVMHLTVGGRGAAFQK